MKNLLKTLGIVLFSAIIVFSIIGCGDDGGSYNEGTITIENLPEDIWIERGSVLSDPNYGWIIINNTIVNTGDYFDPGDKWYSQVIGSIYRYNNNENYYEYTNTLRVNSDEYRYDDEGQFWRRKRTDYHGFTFSGNASVLVPYNIRSNTRNISGTIAFNNAVFNNGHATVDFNSAIKLEKEYY